MTDQVFRASFDSFVSQDHTNGNYGDFPRLRMSAQSSHVKYSYVHFPMQIPSDATIISATLTVYLNGAWAGSNTMTVKRITQHWGERTIDWSSRPNVSATHSAAASVTAGTDRAALQATVTSLVQDWVSGNANYGWRLEVAGSANRDLFSSEYADTSVRPQLTVTWSQPPDAPRNLRPDGARAVSSAHPLLLWESDEPSFIQVQVDDASNFGSTLIDTTYIAATETEYDTALESALTNNTTYYWRVRIKDANGVASEWSDAAEFQYRTLGTVAISAPSGSTVTTTRPDITAALTGRTQAYTAYQVYEDDVLVYERAKLATTATTFTLPFGLIRDTTASYDLVVRIWDTFDREAVGTALDYTEATKAVTLVDGATGPVLTLTAVTDDGHVVLTWTRAAAPDSFAIRIDGVIVEDEIEPADVLVSGTTYRTSFYRAAPWASSASVYSVLAVTSAIQSASNPTASLTFQPRGIWLVDEDSGYEVNILGRDPVSAAVGESGATYFPLGRRDPVRIVDSIRGFEGGISGDLMTWSGTTIAEARAAFQYLKGHPDAPVRLIYGRRNIPVTIGDATMELLDLGEEAYSVDVSYFQRDEWSITLEG